MIAVAFDLFCSPMCVIPPAPPELLGLFQGLDPSGMLHLGFQVWSVVLLPSSPEVVGVPFIGTSRCLSSICICSLARLVLLWRHRLLACRWLLCSFLRRMRLIYSNRASGVHLVCVGGFCISSSCHGLSLRSRSVLVDSRTPILEMWLWVRLPMGQSLA